MRLFLFLLLFTLLGACASVPPPPLPPTVEQLRAWDVRRTSLTTIARWDLRGSVSVLAGSRSVRAVIHWIRDPRSQRIDLIFPFGAGTLRLTQDEHGVELLGRDNQVLRGTSARALLAQATGWEWPADELGFWVVGLPAPKTAIDVLGLDQEGRLANLEQGGWRVEILKYIDVGSFALPSRLSVERLGQKTPEESIDVTLSVESWTLGGGSEP